MHQGHSGHSGTEKDLHRAWQQPIDEARWYLSAALPDPAAWSATKFGGSGTTASAVLNSREGADDTWGSFSTSRRESVLTHEAPGGGIGRAADARSRLPAPTPDAAGEVDGTLISLRAPSPSGECASSEQAISVFGGAGSLPGAPTAGGRDSYPDRRPIARGVRPVAAPGRRLDRWP